MDEIDARRFCDLIRQTGFERHCYSKSSFTEKTYEHILVHRFRKASILVERQFS